MLLAGAALLLLLLVLPPFINVNRYRSDVAGAIGRGLGRPVTVGSVRLRLFPQPGFSLSNVAVADDPALSAEPLLRADEVSASLRLSSLWRGRLEIARLSLTDPSLNLVRGENGRWNLQPLLERAARVPAAPTAKASPESRLRFPYIEADGGRINLKIGQEKIAYALTDADFALWLASEDQWEMRLQARPLRTDTNISDTGTLRVSGTIARGRPWRDTLLALRLELEDAQLGQLTRLIYGRDRGWRGTLAATASVVGSPASLAAVSDLSVDDFRRYDLAGGGSLRLRSHCSARIDGPQQRFSMLQCVSPVGGGYVAVKGELTGLPHPSSYSLSIAAENLPANAVVNLLRHMKKDLPDDLAAAGSLEASFDLRKGQPGEPDAWAGAGATSDLRLRSRILDEPLALGQLRFAVARPGASRHAPRLSSALPWTIAVAPFEVDLDGSEPATAQASFSRSAYQIQLQGDARLPRVMQLARALGLPATAASLSGFARLNLQLSGSWSGFAPPLVTGSAQLRDVTASISRLAAPLEINSATAVLSPQELQLEDVAAAFPGLRLGFAGSLRLPRRCLSAPQCPVEFDLRSDQLSLDDLNRLLNPSFRRRPWYDLLASNSSGAGTLRRLRAQGSLRVSRLQLRSLTARNVTAKVQWEDGILQVSDLKADLLGGKHDGSLRADFTGSEPAYDFSGALTRVSLDQLSTLMRDPWASGHADATYRATAVGWDAARLLASATGSLSFDWRDGSLPHLALAAGTPALRLRRFAGRITLGDRTLTLSKARLDTAAASYQVTGTTSFARELKLVLAADGKHAFNISGTLERPRVAPVLRPQTEAALQ